MWQYKDLSWKSDRITASLDSFQMIDRRGVLQHLLATAFAAPLVGCASSRSSGSGAFEPVAYSQPILGEEHIIPSVDLATLPHRFRRQRIADPTGAAPGTIVVDSGTYHLYLVEPGGRALRYGIGVGREGRGWTGRAVVGRKRRWPRWRPPAEMIARDPSLAAFNETDGQAAGPENPLGARALDLFQDGRDTLFRIHGSLDGGSIGGQVSAGCIRMLNHDVIDLYERTPVGTEVIVR